MGLVQELRGYLEEYDQAVAELQKNRRMFDGVLGLGTHPGSAACHEILDKQVAELCRRAGEEAWQEEAAPLMQAIFQAERDWKGPEYARLMLIALQRHTAELIPGLQRGEREALAAWYRKEYPRRKRLPVQEQIFKALEEA